jgi:hypothetical protein
MTSYARAKAMAGRPKKRLAPSKLQEQLLARDDPRVLPPGFRDWPRDRQLEWDASLLQVATVCTWPVNELDHGRLAAQIAGVSLSAWRNYECGRRPVPQWLMTVLHTGYPIRRRALPRSCATK